MSFNSLVFLIFALLFFLAWQFVKGKKNIKYFFLIISSFLFYGWWDWRFLFLIIFSGLIDFYAAKYIHKNRKLGRLLLILSLVGNLGSLAVFKYSIFIAQQLEKFLEVFAVVANIQDQIPEFAYLLPIGISFYTFQSMSYTIDVYKGKLRPTDNILHFFSYLVMFPQLVAGPIVRAKDFLGQLQKNRKISELEFWNGIKLILIGYFQKTVLADNLGVLVNQAFEGVDNGVGLYWWVVMICFAFQIYFDFSGYSQIARGLAKLMGYHFRMNFNHPYLATSMKDFWSRWHISLSTWFRDYVYIPLGGSKKGEIRSHVNMWMTMLLSGLWHGAAANFLLWGGFHSFVLSIERVVGKVFQKPRAKLFRPLLWIITIVQILIGWVFFRSGSFDQIVDILSKMFLMDFDISFIDANLNVMLFLIAALIYEGAYYLSQRFNYIKRFGKMRIVEAITFALVLSAILFFRGPEEEFIYFQF